MKKILIAEDDKFLANAYRVKLTKAGFDIRIAKHGQETMDILGTFKPDLILLDLVMPIKDGFIVLNEIKNNPQLKSIPVLIASNLGQKEDIDKGMAMGAADYVVKSNLSMEKLIEKINSLLGIQESKI